MTTQEQPHYTSEATPEQQRLPFFIQVASKFEMREVAELRAASYGKHMPELGAKLAEPEAADFEIGCEVLVARSKLDGTLLGTLRTHSNLVKPIPLQRSMDLPAHFSGTRLVETTRLCVKGSPSASVVRSALFKALFQYCLAQKVDWMLAAGRRPVDRIYDSLLFADVNKPGEFYPMAHANGVPHRVMCFSPQDAQAMWSAAQHPLYGFVFVTQHPDIDLSRAARLDFAWPGTESLPEFDDSTLDTPDMLSAPQRPLQDARMAA